MIVKDTGKVTELQNEIKKVIDGIDNSRVLEFLLNFIMSSWESWK